MYNVVLISIVQSHIYIYIFFFNYSTGTVKSKQYKLMFKP